MRIKVFIGFLLMFLLPLSGVGQELSTDPATASRQAGVKLGLDQASNALNTRMLMSVFYGGALYLQPMAFAPVQNRIGSTVDYALWVQQPFRSTAGKNSPRWQLRLESHHLTEAVFSDDFYHLALGGNATFAGQSADFSGMIYKELAYYQLKGGIAWAKPEKGRNYGAILSLNLLNQWRELQLPRSAFYTSPDGDSLALSGTVDGYFLDTADLPLTAVNGYGAGLDLWYEYANPQLFDVRAEVQNMGFLRAQSMRRYHSEQSLVFEGLELPSLLSGSLQPGGITLSDTIKKYLWEHSESGRHTLYTPTTVSVRFRRLLPGGLWQADLLLRYRFFSVYAPLVEARLRYFIRKELSLAPSLSYGGYAGLNAGLAIDWKSRQGLRLQAGTRYLSGMLLQNYFSGMGAFINFTYQF